VKCAEFHRWLDHGRPGEAAAAATAHASSCTACAQRLAAEEVIDRLLAEPGLAAPAGFTDRLMARLPARPMAPVPLVGPATPWWLRAATDPAALLAFSLTGLVAWLGGALWQAGSGSGRWLTDVLVRGAHSAGLAGAIDLFRGREMLLGLELALACLWLLAAPSFVRWTARAGKRAVSLRPL